MPIQQEGEEEEEEFYEALDKIPSSSSDGEGYEEFPPISADVWILDPSPIQERRSRLLSQMGLADDPSLRRVNPTAAVPRSRSDSSAKTKPPLAARPLSMPAISLDHSSDDDDNADVDVKRCTIRSLDTGREFVVGADGAGGNLREVGTGRHLSMEEFDIFVAGQSPIVQELMRRQDQKDDSDDHGGSVTPKRRKGWFKRSIENVVGGGRQQCATTAEKETSSSSATADNLHGPQRTKVRRCGKPRKELTGLFMSQEMKAHDGSIWTIRFSLDGRYLASAGEDCVINVWKVSENDGFNSPAVPFDGNGPNRGSDLTLASACIDGNSHWEKKRRAKMLGRRRSASSVDQLMVPEYVFALSEKPTRSFKGHLDDVLDLSWSKSQYLLSSSMDKTVRLWHLSSNSCLKTFSHSDYVTCIQFNPVDDSYFISGSLDGKVRIWNIPNRQVVDWNGLCEMVTAACYTPDGKSALVGTHKGNCFSYNTSEHSLLQKRQLDLEKKKSSLKKITGFQFSHGKSSEVLITSADSRIRVIDSDEVLVRKFKGFRNTSSQISACLTANGKYVISASEDSHVYVWKYDVADSPLNISKSFISSTQCYEHFYCPDVTVAIPWPITGKNQNGHHASNNNFSKSHHNGIASNFCEKVAATWPEEKLLMTGTKNIPPIDGESCNGSVVVQSRPAWGMVIVTAGRGGQIRIYQNFGFPLQS